MVGWQQQICPTPTMINLAALIDDAKCYQTIRQLRWVDGVDCPGCDSREVIKRGKDDTQSHRQRYQCKGCEFHFDDLTGSIFAGHHQPLQSWILKWVQNIFFMYINTHITIEYRIMNVILWVPFIRFLVWMK